MGSRPAEPGEIPVLPEYQIGLNSLTFLRLSESIVGMLRWILVLLGAARAPLKSRNQLALGNLALRQQLAMLRQSVKRPRVTYGDRLFWILYAKTVSGWRALLHTLHPDTAVRWHRERIRQY